MSKTIRTVKSSTKQGTVSRNKVAAAVKQVAKEHRNIAPKTSSHHRGDKGNYAQG